MIFKKPWFYIILYAIIFLLFRYLDYSIIKQPRLSYYNFLTSMIIMIVISIIAIISSFKEMKINKRAGRGYLIFSICLNIFASGWLCLILLIQSYNN